jgi:hypothetical protein
LNNENSELDRIIEVKGELRTILLKRRELIEKLGFAFEKVVTNKESVCEEIKNCLQEEIALGIISVRTIEQSCKPEWKKKTRPKHENEKIAFSHNEPENEEEKQRKIVIDTLGNPVQDTTTNSSDRSNSSCPHHEDDELVQRLSRTVRELMYENKKLREEKDKVVQTLYVQKQKEDELLRKVESTTALLQLHDTVLDIDFSIDYRSLQNHMKEIYKSAVRQEVWFTAKIDASTKRVISAQIGRKLLPQNVTETGK